MLRILIVSSSMVFMSVNLFAEERTLNGGIAFSYEKTLPRHLTIGGVTEIEPEFTKQVLSKCGLEKACEIVGEVDEHVGICKGVKWECETLHKIKSITPR